MADGKKGGYTAITIGTTVGMSTSVPVTGLWEGTDIGEGEALTGADAAGNVVGTGTRQSPVIRTTAITSAVITLMEGYKSACTEIYSRWSPNGGGSILLGPARVSAVRFVGAAAGGMHQYVIELSLFDENSTDFVTIA